MISKGFFYFFPLAIPAVIPVGHEEVREVVYSFLGSNPKNKNFPEAAVVVYRILLPI